jgi:hypothetical protein
VINLSITGRRNTQRGKMKMVKSLLLALVIGLSLMFAATVTLANPHLVSDPNEHATRYVIVLENDPADPNDDQTFNVTAQQDGSLRADLVNMPAGLNKIVVRSGNAFYESVAVPFEFTKSMPGIPSNVALVRIGDLAYLKSAAQVGIDYYRVIIDGDDFMVDAEDDGSLLYSLEGLDDGIHSIEAHAINVWGESNPAPLGFTKTKPGVPENLRLQ